MAAFFAFVGILLLSTVVALLATLQLGDYFGANGEFILVIAAVGAFCLVALLIFAIAYALARSARQLQWIAFLLALAALAPAVLPQLVQQIADRSTDPYTVGDENTAIVIELVIPSLLAVLVQWGLLRRRWLCMSGEEDLTRWPWVTTAVAGLVILNPLGLTFVGEALRHSSSDLLWEFTATVTAAVFGTLLVMAWIECYIRGRISGRRVAAQAPSKDGETKTPG